MRSLAKVVRTGVLLVAGTIAGLLIAELILRFAGVGDPSFGRVDPVTGWSGYPNASGWWRSEGTAFARYNSAGFKDLERTLEKPAGVYRVAILGDSYTEALQVPLEAGFCAIVGKEVERCAPAPATRIEVLNFGVSGFGTAQELLLLRDRVLGYHPDLVLLAFLSGNDVVDNSRALSGDARKPYFVKRSGSLVLDDSFRTSSVYLKQRVQYALVRWSRICQLIKRWVRARESRAALQGREDHAWNETRLEVYREPVDTPWKDAWDITESLIVRMQDDARAANARFAVVTLSNSLQVYPDPAVRTRHLEELHIEDPFYPDKRIARLGEAHGFPVLNLAPLMLVEAQSRHVSLHGFPNAWPDSGHWNEVGNRVAGTLIASWLCGILETGASGAEGSANTPNEVR